MHIDSITDILFCAFIINHEVLIFMDFVDFEVHVKRKHYIPTKYNFPIDWCLLCPQPRIQEPKYHCILWKARILVITVDRIEHCWCLCYQSFKLWNRSIMANTFRTRYISVHFCVVFCISLFALLSVYPLVASLFVLLPFTAYDHLLCIFKPSLRTYYKSPLVG